MQPAHAAYIQQGNLVGYWPLDETSGTTTADVSGYGNDGTYIGSPTPSNDYPANSFSDTESLAFNGSNYVAVSDNSALDNVGAVTLSTWVKFNNTSGNQTIVAKWQVGVKQQWVLQLNSDHISWWTGNGATSGANLESSQAIATGKWYHLVATADSSGFEQLYIDGSLDTSATESPIGVATGTPLTIGGKLNSSGTYFEYLDGNVDDVRLYNRVLLPAEIGELAAGNNTTATWTGAGDYNYNNPANWDINAVPDAYTNIVVPKAASSVHWPSLYSDIGMANLDNQGLIYLGDYNLTFNDDGTFSNTGTFQLNGDNTLTNFTNDTDSGEIKYSGPATYTGLPTGNSYYDLSFDKGTGYGTWSLQSGTTLNVSHNFSIENNVTFNAGNSTINVGGDWSNGGSFNAGTSTVNLVGNGTQQVLGSNNFYNFGKSPSSSGKILFQSGSTQTVSNNLVLEGSSGNLLQLGSTNAGTQWKINPEGSYNVGFLDVQDSNNISTANTLLVSAKSTSGGNNTNWDIAAPTVSALGPANYVNGSWGTDNKPELLFTTADADSSKVTYEVQVDNNSDFSSPEATYNSGSVTVGSSAAILTSALPDGRYYWRVKVTDVGNLSSAWSVANGGAVAFGIDTAVPNALTADPSAGSYGSTRTVSLTATDNTGGSGIANIYYTNDGTAPSKTNGTKISSGDTVTVDKTETIKAIAYDNAGNASPVMTEQYTITRTDTWTGSVSNFWDNPSNWSDGIVPDINTAVIIPAVNSPAYPPVLDVDASVSSLTIATGAQLGLSGHNLTFASGGTFSNDGVLYLEGNETLTNFTNDTDSGDIRYIGSGTYGSLPTGTNYYNLDFDGTGSWQLPNSTININGDYFAIQAGTVDAGSSTINFKASRWQNYGRFDQGTSTVNFVGQTQAIQGSNTFYNFKKVVTTQAYSLVIDGGTTQTITHELTLTGTSAASLTLHRYTGTGDWNINPIGAVNLSYLMVNDSNNISGTTLDPANSGGSGDTGWFFSPPILSGLGPVNYTNGSWGKDATPTLTFTVADSDSDSVNVSLQIDNNSDFSSPEVFYATLSEPLGSASFTVGQPTGLGLYYVGHAGQTLSDGKYYWRAVANDNGGTTSNPLVANSGGVAFGIDTTAPNTPTASPAGGTFASAQTVKLTATDNPGGSGIDAIHYTLDGSTPMKSSTKYTGAITVDKSETVKAIAYDKAGNASPVMSEDYTIVPSSQTDGGDSDKDSPKSSSPTASKDDSTSSGKNTGKNSQTEVGSSSDTNDKPSSASSNSNNKSSQGGSANTSRQDTIQLNNARQKNSTGEDAGAFLGLGWWWLLIIAILIFLWGFIMGYRRRKSNQEQVQ